LREQKGKTALYVPVLLFFFLAEENGKQKFFLQGKKLIKINGKNIVIIKKEQYCKK